MRILKFSKRPQFIVIGQYRLWQKPYLCSMNFTETLLRWYASNGRSLPWRATTSPYAIWLSEIILQQTRVAQGEAYWHRFLAKWPTVDDLAAATEDEVLRMWQGLGYYSRARNLHAAARQIAAAGRFPDTYEGIRLLRGVGDYTAAAIASFAFGLPHAAVDGNAYRVMARYFGIDTPIGDALGKRTFAQLAQSLLPSDRAADFNQAMMDFGATHCTPRAPHCVACPMAETCDALRTGRVLQLPVKRRTVTVQERRFTYLYIRCVGRTAIHQRGAGDIWQGLWEPLLIEPSAVRPAYELRARRIKHVLTHRVLYADLYLYQPPVPPDLPEGYRWVDEAELEQYALPRLVEKLLALL